MAETKAPPPLTLALGRNIAATITGDVLTLQIDMTKDFGASKSGKSVIVATTQGNATLPNGCKLGLNLFK